MSEWNLNSPLLNEMQVLSCLCDGDGVCTYEVKSTLNENTYIFKNISVPASQRQIEGLRYSGAIKTAAEAQEYYAKVVNDYRKELELLKRAAASGNIACYPAWHVEPKNEQVGFDIHLLAEKRISLREYLQNTPITHAKAANLALDLCNSLLALRKCGLVHYDLKPNNIYLNSEGHFVIGDLGLLQIEDLRFAAVPERVLGDFSAPELYDVMQYPGATIDIYSLGLVLYSIYNGGHSPFEDEETSAKSGTEKRLSGAELPAPLFADYEISAIILKACTFRPEDRYQSPAEMLEELEAYIRRNEPEETLLVPPIVADDDLLLTEEAMNEEIVPMQFAKAEDLGDEFIHHFSPDAEVLNESIEAVQNDSDEQSVVTEEAPEEEQEETEAEKTEEIASTTEDIPAAVDEPDFIDDEYPTTTEPRPAKTITKKHRKAPWIVAITAAVVGLLVGAYFLLIPGIRGFNIVETGTDSFTIELVSAYGASAFAATCTDTYGNRFAGTAEGSTFTFTSLDPGTQYTVRMRSALGLSVRGTNVFHVSTAQATNILFFTAKPLSESVVELSFSIEGRDQETWTVVYGSGEEQKSVSFSGHSVKITDLQPNSKYTFTLQNSEFITLSGETQAEYDTTVHINIFETNVVYTEHAAHVSWKFEGRPPQSWTVMYLDTNGQKQELTTQESEIELKNLETETDYSVEVFCSGMSSATVIPVRREVPVVNTFEAASNEDGTLTVTWTTDETLPDGWIVSAHLANGMQVASAASSEVFTVTLNGLVPETEYMVYIKPANGWGVSGNFELNIKTPPIAKFTQNNLKDAYIGLFRHSKKSQWGVDDLLTPRTTYSVGESIAFALQPLTKIKKVEQKIVATTVLRDPTGRIIYQTAEERMWNNLWDQNLYLGEVVGLSLTPGTYKLEVYFNSGFVTAKDIIVN